MIGATNGTITASYQYDPFGRRIAKTVGGVTTNFIYDGDQIIAEYDGTGALQKKYVYGQGIDEPVMMTSSGNKYFYNRDGLGSITEITDNAGAVTEKYSYDAYGKTTIKDASDNVLMQSAIGNRFGFTGRELDTEIGLYYYRARQYSPDLGRFLQIDPIGYYDSMNLYEMVGNNPINYLDPFGLKRKVSFGKWILPLEIQSKKDPNGGRAVAETHGPFWIVYGPTYRAQNPSVQEATRYHEYVHVGQWGWGIRDIWDQAWHKPYSSREMEAYVLEKKLIEKKLQNKCLDAETRKALEEEKDGLEWMVANPQYMW